MKTFDELLGPNDVSWCTTLAYWLGTHPPEQNEYSAQSVVEALHVQYDMEDQAFSPEAYTESPEPARGILQPIAPITLTDRWCPLPLAREILGQPEWWATYEEFTPIGAVARWGIPAPETLEALEASRAENAHAGHFLFLLRLAGLRALDRGHALLLACQPGWSYEDAVANPLGGVAGMAALGAGRLYPERIPSGAFPSLGESD